MRLRMWAASILLMVGVAFLTDSAGQRTLFPGEAIVGSLLLFFVPALIIEAAADEIQRRRAAK